MRGHIRKRDDRSWAVVVDVGHDSHTGKRRQKWVSVKGTKRAAERRLAEVVRDLNEGTYVEPSRVTLPDYLDRWIRDYVSVSVRERTAQGYRGIVRRLQPRLGPGRARPTQASSRPAILRRADRWRSTCP